jgi:2-methylcitrate dehydratase PrpD
MPAEATQVLAHFAASLHHEDVPVRVRDHCKNLFLDALACALAGHRGEETGQVAALAAGLAQSRESSVIGGERLSLVGATLFNGYLITAVTMCDVHRATHTHVTPEVVPPALAIAEREGATGRELLTALAVGFEVLTRVGIGMDWPAARAKGWHGPGVIGPFGAAAAAGRLLGLDADAMARAFGLAGSQAAGTYAAWGTPTVKFHQCRGALSGLMAALLAREGFVATREFLTAKDGGLYNTYAEGGRADAAIADIGQRWELEQVGLRLWPSASAIQGMNTALFDIIGGQAIDLEEIERVRIAVSPGTFDLHGKLPYYKGKFEALLSAHYTAAVALCDRELTLRQFEAARYDDARLRRFAAERVEVRPDSALTGAQAVVTIERRDGATLSARCDHPRGSPENPLSRAQIEQKFRAYASERLPQRQVDQVIEAVLHLEKRDSVAALMQALRSPRNDEAAAVRTAAE